MGFWHIGQLRPLVELQSADNRETDSVVAFADCSFGFYMYGVRLSANGESTTQVAVSCPYGRFVVAETFSEFLIRYASGDWSVLFPEISAVADEEGLGGEVDGAVSYVVRWSDVRQIEVEVFVPRWEPGDPLACWVVRADRDAAPFTAPVDTIAGGHVVRKTIRSLLGLDEHAFRAARDAEARRERGTFVVWRATESG